MDDEIEKTDKPVTERVFGQELSRKRFLQLTAGLGLTTAGLVTFAAQCGGGGAAPTATTAPAAATTAPSAATEVPTTAPSGEATMGAPTVVTSTQGLASGMIGGPSGFEGAERYQYPEDSQEGRAITGVKALSSKPDKLVIAVAEGAIGHWTQAFPSDLPPYPKGAPTAAEVWEKETGIKLEFVGVPPDQMYTKLTQEYATKAGQFDIMSHWVQNIGDIAESGAAVNLDEYVAKYKPEWDDPKWGFVGGAPVDGLMQKYMGSVWSVSMDGDWQIWFYRKDLMEDPNEQKAFKDKYGWDLQWPETWDQHAQVAEFFTRPDQNLLGATDLRNQYWGYVNWQQRFACAADPSMYYWDKDGKAIIAGPEGVQAAKEYVDQMKFHHKDAISWGWSEQYQNFSEGGAFMTSAFPSCSKFSGPGNPQSKVAGKVAAGLQPGRIVGGKLIRRPLFWAGNSYVVMSTSKNQEASYLWLQWATGGRMYPFITANPAGFDDLNHVTDITDPLVSNSYGTWLMPVFEDTIKHSIPPIKVAGSNEYATALDTNLLAALGGNKTPEQAMKDTADEWDKITDRMGKDKLIKAFETEKKEWSTVADTPKIQKA